MALPTIKDSRLKPSNSRQDHAYRLNSNVFFCLEGGIAQLLDFQRGQFYALDALASLMVSLVLEEGFEQAVTQIHQTYEVTESQVRADLTELLQNLVHKKLLITPEKFSPAPLRGLSDGLRTIGQLLGNLSLWLLQSVSFLFRRLFNPQPDPNSYTVDHQLTLSWFSFRLLGWSRTIALWQQWHQPVGSSPVLSSHVSMADEMVQTIDRMVREAAGSKLFLPIVCKERALVGYHLLRTFYGLPATLLAGNTRHPFQIHAWVEWEGRTVTDDADHCKQFTPVVRYP
jgi:hypothetical protein